MTVGRLSAALEPRSRGRGLFGVVDADGFRVRSRRIYYYYYYYYIACGSFNAGSNKIHMLLLQDDILLDHDYLVFLVFSILTNA